LISYPGFDLSENGVGVLGWVPFQGSRADYIAKRILCMTKLDWIS
jgi:hypothetical protein